MVHTVYEYVLDLHNTYMWYLRGIVYMLDDILLLLLLLF